MSTGGVIVKTKFRQAVKTGLLAKLDFIFDRKFTEWLPIWVLVVEHPEGIFVIDTGENSRISDPDYFKRFGRMANWFNTSQYKFKVQRDEEIDQQLLSRSINPNQVSKVILTHLHLDHVDGLSHFPGVPIIVNKDEWDKPYGDLPGLYPPWFSPQLVKLEESVATFERAYPVTQARDIWLIETPGHTWHHCSVLIKADPCDIIFGADVCYDQDQLITLRYSGANASHRQSVKTYKALREYCRQNPSVYLPSHDLAAGQRLLNLQAVSIP
jgi:glyoxylase-like metal-dependent hydrolase (beta-lactamase superfamily II)